MTETFDSEKAAASAWFRQLRDDIVSRFEAIEMQHEIDAPCGTLMYRRAHLSHAAFLSLQNAKQYRHAIGGTMRLQRLFRNQMSLSWLSSMQRCAHRVNQAAAAIYG